MILSITSCLPIDICPSFIRIAIESSQTERSSVNVIPIAAATFIRESVVGINGFPCEFVPLSIKYT